MNAPNDSRLITGMVHLEYGGPAGDRTLRVYRKGFGGVTTWIGEVGTAADGRYRLELPGQDGSGPLNLELRMLQRDRTEVVLTDTLFDVRPGDVINLVAPASVQPPAPEHGQLLADTERHVAGQSLGTARQTADQPDLTLLQENTGWDARLVALAATAEHVAADTGLPAPAAYAMVRAGLPHDPAGLAGVAPASVARALNHAATAGIVELTEAARQQAVAAFAGFARSHRLAATAPGTLSSQRDMLAAAELSEKQAAAFDDIEATVAHTGGTTDDLWAAAAKADLPVNRLKLVGKLGRLTLNNALLTERLVRALKGNDLGPALVSQGLHQPRAWEKAVRAAADSAEVAVDDLIPPAFTGQTSDVRLAAYAADMARKVRISFPTNVVAAAVATGRLTLPGTDGTVRRHTAAVLDRAAALDLQLGRTPVSAMLREHGSALLDGIPADQRDAVTDTVRTLHRVYQITPTDEAMASLLDDDLRSAYDVTAMPLRTFLARHGERFASTAEATRTYAKAQQVSSASLTTVHRGPAARRLPAGVRAVRSGDRGPPGRPRPTDRALPDHGAAVRHARTTARATTAARCSARPPTWWICCISSTHRPTVAADAGTAPYPASPGVAGLRISGHRHPHGTGTDFAVPGADRRRRPAADLREHQHRDAVPRRGQRDPRVLRGTRAAGARRGARHRRRVVRGPAGRAAVPDPEAYDILRRADYPMVVPFDLWLETVRRLLDHFGTPLWQVLDAFRRTDELYPARAQPLRAGRRGDRAAGPVPRRVRPADRPDPEPHWHERYGYPAGRRGAGAGRAVQRQDARPAPRRDLPGTARPGDEPASSTRGWPPSPCCRSSGSASPTCCAIRARRATRRSAPDEQAAFEAALAPIGGPAALAPTCGHRRPRARCWCWPTRTRGCGFETTILQYADGTTGRPDRLPDPELPGPAVAPARLVAHRDRPRAAGLPAHRPGPAHRRDARAAPWPAPCSA